MNKAAQLIFFIALFCACACAFDETKIQANPSAGLVRHFVSFKFLANVTQEQQEQVMTVYTALQYECVNQTTGELYIVSFDAGYANSPEGKDQGMQQGYIVTFSSIADRDYFVGRPLFNPYDPHHDKFKQFVGPLLDSFIVFDMTVLP